MKGGGDCGWMGGGMNGDAISPEWVGEDGGKCMRALPKETKFDKNFLI